MAKKLKIFGNFFFKCRFWQFFDIQMAIFRRSQVESQSPLWMVDKIWTVSCCVPSTNRDGETGTYSTLMIDLFMIYCSREKDPWISRKALGSDFPFRLWVTFYLWANGRNVTQAGYQVSSFIGFMEPRRGIRNINNLIHM